MEEASTAVVPSFLVKLWAIVDNTDLDNVIRWSEVKAYTGRGVGVERDVASERCGKMWENLGLVKHLREFNYDGPHFSPVVRLQRPDGFRKVIGLALEKTGPNASAVEFQHPLFKKGGKSFLENIKRKVPSEKMQHVKISNEMHRMMTEVQEMNNKQNNMDAKFEKLKKQYATLWLEMKNLRQKYGEQQQVLTQILQFILSGISENHIVNKNRKRSLPVISEVSASKCARPYFHIPEEKEKEAMEILKDGYALIEDKYKNLLDSDLPTLKDEYKNLVSSVDQTNEDHGKDPKMSSQDVPMCEDSVITDLSLAIPDLQDLMTVESFVQETKDISLELESLLSQDIDSVLTEDKSDIQCDTTMNRDEMNYISGDLMELKSPLYKKNVNYSSDHASEPVSFELLNLMTNENETLLNVHVMAETDNLSLMKNQEGEISLLDASGKEGEMLMNDFGGLQDSSDLYLDDLKNSSNVLPNLCDHDYISVNIPSQQYVANPTENVMPYLCMETSGECKLFPFLLPNSGTNFVEEATKIDPST
ncbi:heat shock factor protein 3-like [Heterocephalus glaber]|uniref:Heat shock factor protein 3-like n=1 Tax=Heterocephalus glaber TaxID=10181 RepID=A0AAX6QG23_HETGA|nr:heat shock factor protein 3-like [Heterocephalus glaber]